MEPKEAATKVCSLLQDETDPEIKLGSISKQNCEELMNTILEPIVELGNCDYMELAEMLMKLGSLQSQLIGISATVNLQYLGSQILYARDLTVAVQETIKARLISECSCKAK